MVHGAAADGAPAMAGEAQGRTPATSARASLGGRSLSALGRSRARAVLRRAHEREQYWRLSLGHRSALVAGPQAPQPEPSSAVGADETLHRPVAATRPHLPSLSPRAPRRCHPKQEPDAVMPHVRIRGGGHEQSSAPTPTRSFTPRAIVGPIPECTAARRATRCIYSSRVALDIS